MHGMTHVKIIYTIASFLHMAGQGENNTPGTKLKRKLWSVNEDGL
jgi:hypothetical protein